MWAVISRLVYRMGLQILQAVQSIEVSQSGCGHDVGVRPASQGDEAVFPQANGHFALCVRASGDGEVVVGECSDYYSKWEAFRWTEAGGMVGLGDLPGGSSPAGRPG